MKRDTGTGGWSWSFKLKKIVSFFSKKIILNEKGKDGSLFINIIIYNIING
jgi:hypothetical protein